MEEIARSTAGRCSRSPRSTTSSTSSASSSGSSPTRCRRTATWRLLLLAVLLDAEKKDGPGQDGRGADETLVNFLELLIEKHRMPAVFRIRRYYDGLWEQENKILPGQISTATELDKATVKQIGDRIAKDTGQKIELTATSTPTSSAASSARRQLDPRRLDPQPPRNLRSTSPAAPDATADPRS
jgi:hypothetical protein